MIIPKGTRLRLGADSKLEILARERLFRQPIAIVHVDGVFVDSRDGGSFEEKFKNFGNSKEVREWLEQNGVREYCTYQDYALADALAELIRAASRFGASKAYIRSESHSRTECSTTKTEYKDKTSVALYAALYK